MEKNIEKEIKNATSTLLEIVNQSCYNNISKKLMFILSNIKEVEGENSFVQLHNRRRINKLKKPKNFNEIINEVKQFYDEAYDINLFVYKSEKHKTIIEIRYFLKSDLDPDYLKKVTNNPPMLHCKVSIPPYIGTRKEKFDVNWELGGIKYNWNLFWWKRKHQKEISYRLRRSGI